MKTRWVIVGWCVCLLAGCVIGVIIDRCIYASNMELAKKSETKSRITKAVRPEDAAGLWSCYQTPIAIDGTLRASVFSVIAGDGCKESRRDFMFTPWGDLRNNLILFSVLTTYDMQYIAWGGSVSYYRLFGPFGIGGGVILTQREIGLTAGLLVRF